MYWTFMQIMYRKCTEYGMFMQVICRLYADGKQVVSTCMQIILHYVKTVCRINCAKNWAAKYMQTVWNLYAGKVYANHNILSYAKVEIFCKIKRRRQPICMQSQQYAINYIDEVYSNQGQGHDLGPAEQLLSRHNVIVYSVPAHTVCLCNCYSQIKTHH